MNTPLPFECSEQTCKAPTAGDWCIEHDAPHVEIECDGDADDDDGCYCGNGCEK